MSNSSLIPLSAPSTNLFVGLSARERTADAVAPERVNLRDVSIPRTRVLAQSPRAFVAELAAQSLQHRAVVHPYLNAVGLGELPDIRWALADFGQQYHGYSKDFPCYLTAVISRLSDPRHPGLRMVKNVSAMRDGAASALISVDTFVTWHKSRTA